MRNAQHIKWHKTIRFTHLLIVSGSVPLAQIYLAKFDYHLMDGGPFGFIATLYCLAVILFVEQYFFPLSLKGAIHALIAVIINAGVALTVSNVEFLYLFYELFFATICVQAILVILLIITLCFNHRIRFPLFNYNKESPKTIFWIVVSLLFIGSPLLVAPYYYSLPLLNRINGLPLLEAGIIITALVYLIFTNVVQVVRAIYLENKTNEKSQAAKKFEEWQPIVNLFFFLNLMVMFLIMFMY